MCSLRRTTPALRRVRYMAHQVAPGSHKKSNFLSTLPRCFFAPCFLLAAARMLSTRLGIATPGLFRGTLRGFLSGRRFDFLPALFARIWLFPGWFARHVVAYSLLFLNCGMQPLIALPVLIFGLELDGTTKRGCRGSHVLLLASSSQALCVRSRKVARNRHSR
jgi:hypothetical protein